MYVELNLRKPLSNKFLEFENLYFWLALLLLSEILQRGKIEGEIVVTNLKTLSCL